MTNQEILEKAIQKAIDGGWTKWNGAFTGIEPSLITGDYFVYFDYLGGKKPKRKSERHYGTYGVSFASVILDHDFAKALWGGERTIRNHCQYKGCEDSLYDWEWHLQQMVIAEHPIKYLGENI